MLLVPSGIGFVLYAEDYGLKEAITVWGMAILIAIILFLAFSIAFLELTKWKAKQESKVIAKMIGKYVLVRDESAGIFVGTLKEKNGRKVTLTGYRRLWVSAGAPSDLLVAADIALKDKIVLFDVIEVEERIELKSGDYDGAVIQGFEDIQDVRNWMGLSDKDDLESN